MSDTPKLQLPELSVDQSQKEPTHNEALRRLDILVQPVCISRSVTAPPVAVEGDTYIVGIGASGLWNGHDNEVVFYMGSAWIFATPRTGWKYYVQDEDLVVSYDDGLWTTDILGEANTVAMSGEGVEIYKEKVGAELVFRRIKAGSANVHWEQDDDELVLFVDIPEVPSESEVISESESSTSSGSRALAFFLAGVQA